MIRMALSCGRALSERALWLLLNLVDVSDIFYLFFSARGRGKGSPGRRGGGGGGGRFFIENPRRGLRKGGGVRGLGRCLRKIGGGG